MKANELRRCLDREVDAWCRKDYSTLLKELEDDVVYQSGDGSPGYQVEVQLLENKFEYVHAIVSVDDGTLRRAFKPLSRSFIVRRDGRVVR